MKGLVDLSHPAAAQLPRGDTDIVLPVHVLIHRTAGGFIVDTGVPRGESPARGLVRWFVRDIEPVEPLGDILARQPASLAGVLLTHTHLDHVLGLVDVPDSVPIHAGAGDEGPSTFSHRLSFEVFRRGLGERALTTWDFERDGVDLGGVRGIDIVGDGSLFALDAHGHTPGSTAYLARTTGGLVRLTGDGSHTRWGWDRDVTPGTYTADHEANAESLAALRGFVAAHPGTVVYVGHER